MSADLINGLFEMVGGFFIALSCRQLYRDKQVRGVSWLHVSFFAAWGYWNLYFYPAVGAWWSFAGGVGVVSANSAWLLMIFYYSLRDGAQ